MKSLKERTQWAINYVCENRKLSNKTLAELLGVNKDTVGNYRNMAAEPKLTFAFAFCDKFGFDCLWLGRGIGEPFPGAREKYPDICGEPYPGGGERAERAEDLILRGPETPYAPGSDTQDQPPDPLINAMAGLKEIFDSRDPALIPAIQANIQAFQLSVRRDRQIQHQAREIKELEDKCKELEGRVNSVEKKLKKVNEPPGEPDPELKKLSGTL